MEHVVLVDTEDNEIGTMEKMEAHEKGLLHRAFSVLLFDNAGRVLLQKRSSGKYHSSGLWTNTCCSHPLPGESVEHASRRRLKEEMGIDLQPSYSFRFIYRAALDSNLTEHELDHVFLGTFSGEPDINKKEVEDWKYVDLAWVKRDIADHPERYTIWFRMIINHPSLRDISINH